LSNPGNSRLLFTHLNMKWIQKYFNFVYFFKLIGLTIVLNYFSIAFNGIVSPEGSRYSSFLDHNLNYIQWLREFLMYVSNWIAHAFGTNSYISGQQMMNIGKSIEVEIWLPCLGLGIIGFWIAFIVTNSGPWHKKLLWCAGGILCISLINCWRIGLLLVSIDRNWAQLSTFDHHDLFNIAAYVLIGLMMYSYSETKQEHLSGKQVVHAQPSIGI
jgi:exosortase/archaeosortase family protein